MRRFDQRQGVATVRAHKSSNLQKVKNKIKKKLKRKQKIRFRITQFFSSHLTQLISLNYLFKEHTNLELVFKQNFCSGAVILPYTVYIILEDFELPRKNIRIKIKYSFCHERWRKKKNLTPDT